MFTMFYSIAELKKFDPGNEVPPPPGFLLPPSLQASSLKFFEIVNRVALQAFSPHQRTQLKDLEACWKLLKYSAPEKRLKALNEILNQCEKNRDYNNGSVLFDAIQKHLTPFKSSEFLNRLMIFFENRTDMVEKIFTFMRNEKIDNAESWNIRLKVSATNGDERQFFEIFNQINSERISSQPIQILIDHFFVRKKYKEALEIYERFEPYPIKMELSIYNSLILCCGYEKREKKAEDIFRKITEQGLRVTRQSYCNLIFTYSQIKDFTAASKTFNELKNSSLGVNIESYYHLLSACTCSKQAKEILDQTKKLDFVPDERLCNFLIGLSCEASDFSLLFELYDLAKKKGYSLWVKAYVEILNAFASNILNLNQTSFLFLKNLYEEMKKIGFDLNANQYSLLIRISYNFADFVLLFEIYDLMKKKGFKPTIKASTDILNAFVEKGELSIPAIQFANEICERINKRAIVPDNRGCNFLIELWEGKFQLLELFGLMQEKGYKPSSKGYAKILKVYADNGEVSGKFSHFDEEIFEEIKNRALIPNNKECNFLIELGYKAGHFFLLSEVYNLMKEKGYKPTSKSYACLLKAYADNGEPKSKALALFNSISEHQKTLEVIEAFRNYPL